MSIVACVLGVGVHDVTMIDLHWPSNMSKNSGLQGRLVAYRINHIAATGQQLMHTWPGSYPKAHCERSTAACANEVVANAPPRGSKRQ